MAETGTGRGGAREGAGRKGPKKQDRIVVSITGDLAKKINAARRELGLARNTEVVRALLLRALR